MCDVVVPDGVHRRRAAGEISRRLAGLGVARDVVVVTESHVERYGDEPSLVPYPALRQGRELYRARRIARMALLVERARRVAKGTVSRENATCISPGS